MADWPYNSAQWKRLRDLKLRASPMCEPCTAAGRLTIANTVDHKHAISDGGPAFPGLDGLTSCCTSCHSIKTARGAEAGAVRTTRKVQARKGCDANGNPLDPSHPWAGIVPQSAAKLNKSLRTDALETAAPLHSQLVSGRGRHGR